MKTIHQNPTFIWKRQRASFSNHVSVTKNQFSNCPTYHWFGTFL